MRLMSRGNNVQRLDQVPRICALHKNRVLLLLKNNIQGLHVCDPILYIMLWILGLYFGNRKPKIGNLRIPG